MKVSNSINNKRTTVINKKGMPILESGRTGKVLSYTGSKKVNISLGRLGFADWFAVAERCFPLYADEIQKIENSIVTSDDARLLANKINSGNLTLFEGNIKQLCFSFWDRLIFLFTGDYELLFENRIIKHTER